MRLNHPVTSIRGKFPIKVLALIAILLLALLGGLFHYHESETGAAACSYCQARAQRPVIHLARNLVAPLFETAGVVTPTRPTQLPHIVRISKLVPRAPPITVHPVVFWERGAGLVSAQVASPLSLLDLSPANKHLRRVT